MLLSNNQSIAVARLTSAEGPSYQRNRHICAKEEFTRIPEATSVIGEGKGLCHIQEQHAEMVNLHFLQEMNQICIYPHDIVGKPCTQDNPTDSFRVKVND